MFIASKVIVLNQVRVSGRSLWEGSLQAGIGFMSVLMVCLLLTTPVWAEQEEFLSVEQAFRMNWGVNAGQLHVNWQIADGYYLYHDKVKFELKPAGNARLEHVEFVTEAHSKQDEYFGNVKVYSDALDVRIVLSGLQPDQNAAGLKLLVSYQGCAEAGLCYQPQRRELELRDVVLQGADTDANSAAQNLASSAAMPAQAMALDTALPGTASDVTSYLQQAGLLMNLLTFFVLGLGLALTPCVLPMVPILSSIIVGQGANLTQRKALSLSTVFVLGMSIAYALAGVAVGYFGARANVQMWMQTPWVIVLFAGLFVVLAMSMFGFYELQLPEPLRSRLMNLNQRQQGGSYIGVGLMGMLSALVASPCVSAPLAGVLVYISTTGDAWLGGAALFSLSLGMGAPLLLVALGGGRWLPRSGAWMIKVKNVFGVLLLAVAIWMLQRILPIYAAFALWAALLVISGIHLHALDPVQTHWGKTFKGVGLLCVTAGLTLLYSGLQHPDSPLHLSVVKPAHGDVGTAVVDNAVTRFKRVNSLADLKLAIQQANQQGHWVMLDYYADWCVSCKVMEQQVFHTPEVGALQTTITFLQFDVTEVTNQTQLALQAFGLFGPPSMVFFAPDGQEIKSARIQGEMNKQQFLQHVQDKVIKPVPLA